MTRHPNLVAHLALHQQFGANWLRPRDPLIRRVSGYWPQGLHEFDPVAEGVIDIDPPVPIERLEADSSSRLLKAFGEFVQALHDKGGMSLASGTELRVDTEMDLDTVVLEPAAASALQMGRLGDAPQTEQSSVKRLCRRLLANGHGQLDMINRHHSHSRRLFGASNDQEPVSPSTGTAAEDCHPPTEANTGGGG